MTLNDFIKLREKDWERLAQLLNRHKGRDRLSAAEVREIGALYRAVTSDLALARRDYSAAASGKRVMTYLNQLLTRAHSFIYQDDVNDYGRSVRYFTQVIPQTFRQTALFTFAAFLLFIIPALVGFRLASTNPQVAAPLGLEDQRATLEDQSTWTDIPVRARPYASGFIMTNNIRVALLAFGGGVTFGLFTVWILVMNGLSIGAVLGLAAYYGQADVLLDFIFAHGVVELSVIFMAGGAGLQLGWALLNPGAYTQRDALTIAARRAAALVVISVPLLIGAGLIEGFLSPSSVSFSTKVAVGLGYGALMYAYLTLVGRGKTSPL